MVVWAHHIVEDQKLKLNIILKATYHETRA